MGNPKASRCGATMRASSLLAGIGAAESFTMLSLNAFPKDGVKCSEGLEEGLDDVDRIP